MSGALKRLAAFAAPTAAWDAKDWDGSSTAWKSSIGGVAMNLANSPTKGTDSEGRAVVEFNGTTHYGELDSLVGEHASEHNRPFTMLTSGNFPSQLNRFIWGWGSLAFEPARKAIFQAGTGSLKVWMRDDSGGQSEDAVSSTDRSVGFNEALGISWDPASGTVRFVFKDESDPEAIASSGALTSKTEPFTLDTLTFMSLRNNLGALANMQGDVRKLIYYDNRSFDAAELERLTRYAASDSA